MSLQFLARLVAANHRKLHRFSLLQVILVMEGVDLTSMREGMEVPFLVNNQTKWISGISAYSTVNFSEYSVFVLDM
jgi:hypothetical protein